MLNAAPTDTVPPLLTKRQTAELYGVTTRTVDRWLSDGVLPADARVLIGGAVRYRRAVLIRHIESATYGTEDVSHG